MSTLTDLLKAHDFSRMECADHEGRCCPEGGCHDLRLSQYDHYAAVVADWLETPEAQGLVTSALLGRTATVGAVLATAALADEARKGADQ